MGGGERGLFASLRLTKVFGQDDKVEFLVQLWVEFFGAAKGKKPRPGPGRNLEDGNDIYGTLMRMDGDGRARGTEGACNRIAGAECLLAEKFDGEAWFAAEQEHARVTNFKLQEWP